MPNTYFQFKQFRIDQEKSGMKVCTDSCILGAYANYPEPNSILDIGTGTGLLALMLAQRYNTLIDAVEIDAEAASEAQDNFKNSKWNNRLNLYQQSIQKFGQHTDKKYDLILTNPPFFSNHLKSPDTKRNSALHVHTLSFPELATSAKQLLTDIGHFCIMLPEYETGLFLQEATKVDLHVLKTLRIYNNPGSKIFRIISTYSHTTQNVVEESLIINQSGNNYSSAFKLLLKDYYLHL